MLCGSSYRLKRLHRVERRIRFACYYLYLAIVHPLKGLVWAWAYLKYTIERGQALQLRPPQKNVQQTRFLSGSKFQGFHGP